MSTLYLHNPESEGLLNFASYVPSLPYPSPDNSEDAGDFGESIILQKAKCENECGTVSSVESLPREAS